MVQYPVVLEPDTNGTLLVTFPDLPEACTFGEDEQEALARAVDCLETALAMRIEDRKDIPTPSTPLDKFVMLPALSEAKVELYKAMRSAKVRKAELARRLGVKMPQVDRLLDLDHASRMDQIEAAFRCLDRRIDIQIVNAA
jgi:antitoxin HicB